MTTKKTFLSFSLIFILLISFFASFILLSSTNETIYAEETSDTAELSEQLTEEVNKTCEFQIEGAGIGWLVCIAVKGISEALEGLESLAFSLLDIDSGAYDKPGYKELWRNIRDLMTFAIVGTALFMIISTALDIGIFKNYTVKKYLPRLLIGTIAIQFSWALGDFMIQFINSIGDWVGSLVYSIGGDNLESFGLDEIIGSGEQSLAAGIVSIIAVSSIGWLGMLPILFTLLIGILIGVLFLLIREFLIIILLILAPLGLAFWLLPGNDRAWRVYFRTFFYLLLFYPVIVLLISVGKLMAKTVIDDGGNDWIAILTALILYIGAYAAIPFLARTFSGALGQITGRINDRTKGVIDRPRNTLRQWSKDRRAGRKNAGRIQANQRFLAGEATKIDKAKMRAENYRRGGTFKLPGNMPIQKEEANNNSGILNRVDPRNIPRYTSDAVKNQIDKRQERTRIAGGIVDEKYGKLQADYAKSKEAEVTLLTGNNPAAIRDIVLNKTASGETASHDLTLRQSALNTLIKFKADQPVREIINQAENLDTNDPVVRMLKMKKPDFWDAYKEIAPDLQQFAFNNDGHPSLKPDLNQLNKMVDKMSPMASVKFTKDSWEAIQNYSANTPQIKQRIEREIVGPIFKSDRLRNDLAPDVKIHLETSYPNASNNSGGQKRIILP